MRQETWIAANTASLEGKTVVVTGATGGLGGPICRTAAALGARVIMVNRSREKSEQLRRQLIHEFPQADVRYLLADLTRIDTVRTVCDQLGRMEPDLLILNAGAYAIPRSTCSTGYDNVFQTNFVSHYYMVKKLLPVLARRKARVLAMGSIAHNYSRTDPDDVDFAGRTKASKVYGNSKRFLMYGLGELLRQHPEVDFAIAHPGITFTNITAHYPPLIFAIIKHPMKIIFMSKDAAARSMLRAMFEKIPYLHWIGPRFFNIWGNPSVKKLTTADENERKWIYETSEKIYAAIVSAE